MVIPLFPSEALLCAVSAYEQCFIALPENIALLKKMGDCYLAMGQAHVALNQSNHDDSDEDTQPSWAKRQIWLTAGVSIH